MAFNLPNIVDLNTKNIEGVTRIEETCRFIELVQLGICFVNMYVDFARMATMGLSMSYGVEIGNPGGEPEFVFVSKAQATVT